MKTKIKSLIILIAIFAVSLIAGIVSGCNIGELTAQDLADKMGMDAYVTYYANGGSFVDGTSTDEKAYRYVYYVSGNPIYNIPYVNQSDIKGNKGLAITRANYTFAGWEYCELDENGKPILTDEKGEIRYEVLETGTASIKDEQGIREESERSKRFFATSSGEKVFNSGNVVIEKGKHLYLVATWMPDVVLEYHLVTDKPITVVKTNEDGSSTTETYKTDDIVKTENFSSNSKQLNPNKAPETFEGFTYINLFWDKECTEPVGLNKSIDKQENENSVIYAKYLSGEWTPVKTEMDALNMFQATGDKNYFLVYNIDCSNMSFVLKDQLSGSFNGIIEGNNKTVSNIKVTSILRNAGTFSLLGNLGETAQIKNLNISNVTLTLTANADISLYAIFGTGIAEGAVIENVSLTDLTVNITKQAGILIDNIQMLDSGEYEIDNWLYGAYSTDAQFIEVYGEIVKNATLIINGETITTFTGGQL